MERQFWWCSRPGAARAVPGRVVGAGSGRDADPDLRRAETGGVGGHVEIGYRPVHDYTLTDDAEYIKPKKRVY